MTSGASAAAWVAKAKDSARQMLAPPITLRVPREIT
jgi:hypothetical protein